MAGKALDRVGNGMVPDDFLYGWNHQVKRIRFIDYILAPRENRKGILRQLTYFVELPFAMATKTGLPIDIYLMNREKITGSDIIFCVNDAIGLGILFWKKLGFIKGKIIFIAQSLSERQKKFRNSWIFGFVKSLVQCADKVLTLSTPAKTTMEREYGLSQSKCSVFYFGVDTEFWKPALKRNPDKYLLAVGNDSNRDYQTLVEAIGADYKLIIVTKHKVQVLSDQKIEVLVNISDHELRKLYQGATSVVVPSKKVDTESSGLSVSLQAMACGTPVIVSRSPALEEYFFDERSGCLYYEPENKASLRSAIVALMEDESFRKKLSTAALVNSRKHTSKGMAVQLNKIISQSPHEFPAQ
jgi:glycosyltransferase involved in cell wall biosynthesis